MSQSKRDIGPALYVAASKVASAQQERMQYVPADGPPMACFDSSQLAERLDEDADVGKLHAPYPRPWHSRSSRSISADTQSTSRLVK
jgi:hypothetical protein